MSRSDLKKKYVVGLAAAATIAAIGVTAVVLRPTTPGAIPTPTIVSAVPVKPSVSNQPPSPASPTTAPTNVASSLVMLIRFAAPNSPLEGWSVRWEAGDARSPKEADLDALSSLLQASNVSALVRLQAAGILNDAKDAPNAAAWAKSGLSRAEAEWAKNDGDRVNLTLATQWDILTKAAMPLWKAMDRDGVRSLLNVEQLIGRKDNWTQQPEWDRVNYGQLLLNLKDLPAVLAEVEAIRGDSSLKLNKAQQVRLSVQATRAHLGLHQYEQAKAALQTGDWMANAADAEATRVLAQVEDALELQAHPLPLDVLEARREVDPEIIDWVTRWQSVSSESRPNDAVTLSILQRRVTQSDLTANDRLKIGQLLFNAGDQLSAATWFHAGIDRLKADFDAAVAVSAQNSLEQQAVARKMLNPLLPKLDIAGSMLWNIRDGVSQQKLSEMLLLLPRMSEKDQRPEWARIAHAEALYQQGLNAESQRESDAILADIQTGQHRFVDAQIVEAKWLAGLLSMDKNNSEAAIKHLSDVVKSDSFHHSTEARTMLIKLLVNSGRTREAEAELTILSKKGRGTESTLIELNNVILQAKISAPP